MKTFLVYKITCIPTSQIYIGITSTTLDRRFSAHLYNSQNSYQRGKKPSKFQSELLKYGKDYFKCSILEEKLSKVDALKKEIFYIEQYNSNLCGLNSNSGGGGCTNGQTDEAKKKISDALRGKKRPPEVIEKVRIGNLGKKISPEHKKMIGDANRGRIVGAETREKLSKIHKGKKRSTPSPLKGIPRPPEVIEKIRITNTGKKRSDEIRKKISNGNRGRVASAETREKLRKAKTGRKIILCEESKEKIRCAARYKRTEEHKNNLRNINKGNKYHSYTWKVTLPDNTVKFTKTLSDVINDDKLIRALMSIYRKLKIVKNNKNYGGFTFPHHGYTIQKCNEVYSGLIATRSNVSFDEITSLNAL